MHKIYKILALTLLTIATPLAAQYDAHLVGHVLDEKTGEHLRSRAHTSSD